MNNKKNKATTKFSEFEGIVFYDYEHSFNLTEHAEKSKELVAQVMLENETEDEKKKINKEFSDKLIAIKQKINALTAQLNAGKEFLYEKCVVRFSEDFTRKYIIHPDTQEIIFEGAVDLMEQANAKETYEKLKRGEINGNDYFKILTPQAWENELNINDLNENEAGG